MVLVQCQHSRGFGGDWEFRDILRRFAALEDALEFGLGGVGVGGGVEFGDDLVAEPLFVVHAAGALGGADGGEAGFVGVGQQFVVEGDDAVGERHNFAEHIAGRVLDGDVVAERLAHPADAVGAGKDGHSEDDLRALPDLLLQLAPDEEVEELVGSAELDVGLDGDGVVGLEEGVEHFGDGDGALGFVALGEVVAVEELVDREAGREADDVGERELAEPLALVDGAGFVRVDDLEELAHIGFGVGLDVVGAEHRSGVGLAGGVADLGCPVADDEGEFVAEVLELAEFAEADDVAEVEVWPAGVEAHFETEGLAFAEAGDEFGLRDDLGDAALRDAVEGLGIKGGH